MQYISAVISSHPETEDDEKYCVFDLQKMNWKIASMKLTKEVPVLVRNEEKYIGTSDITDIKTFQSSERHTDVFTYDFSE